MGRKWSPSVEAHSTVNGGVQSLKQAKIKREMGSTRSLLIPPSLRILTAPPPPTLARVSSPLWLISSPYSNRSGSSFSAMSAGAEAEPTPTAGASEEDEVVVQYVVMRRDLVDTWPTGSVVAQGCHAAVAAVWAHKDDPHTLRYCSPQSIDSMHKVTLEVKGETQMLNLSEKLTAGGIAHKLWIEQPENVPTCIATKPYPKSAVASFFKKLKLCK